ncbi:hypothetical protein C9J01_12680 [Photobacterium rosenbergii]|uniref:Uncharacterized protein n=1 Tax=Photobacterium rosenbergii TaxID=294936 RepID=A0A2T3NEB6_9GAMM|nr:hypothetical protein C9J01_12680 [Photobacterium rosenbergii]
MTGPPQEWVEGKHLEYAGCIALIIPTNLGALASRKGNRLRFFLNNHSGVKIMQESSKHKGFADAERAVVKTKTMDNYAFNRSA